MKFVRYINLREKAFMLIIMFGPPGSGKGTNAEFICSKYGLSSIATGDIMRSKMHQQDALGKQISKIMGTGELFSDDIINPLVSDAIKEKLAITGNNGLLFDGYPRTSGQFDFLNKLLTELNIKIDVVLLFQIPDSTIIERVTSRRIDKETGKVYNLQFNPPPANIVHRMEQRLDDTIEVITNRLNVYKQQTEPLIQKYKALGIVRTVDASETLVEAQERIVKVLSEFKQSIN